MSSERSAIPCTECQAGVMHRHYVAYFTWLGDELITVPDFPAWVCDICGRREYDPYALNQLSMLLNPSAGKPVHKQRRVPTKIQNKKNTRPSRP